MFYNEDVIEIIKKQIEQLRNENIGNVQSVTINLEEAIMILTDRDNELKKVDERLEEGMQPKEDVKSWYGYAIDKLGNLIYTTFSKKRLD